MPCFGDFEECFDIPRRVPRPLWSEYGCPRPPFFKSCFTNTSWLLTVALLCVHRSLVNRTLSSLCNPRRLLGLHVFQISSQAFNRRRTAFLTNTYLNTNVDQRHHTQPIVIANKLHITCQTAVRIYKASSAKVEGGLPNRWTLARYTLPLCFQSQYPDSYAIVVGTHKYHKYFSSIPTTKQTPSILVLVRISRPFPTTPPSTVL
ncbi:hypothetical protein PILCRDRAFT_400346 [Piloderma croceum F 1598]|uniref:Uncharacterized protein n=1 Tax=Piloderma croceum (strain F 1598) TaxID=765440 RepID=A0A0C3FIH7_PILCF|nr:hypothetical protein PILCRDRAFT_400346 [Piloderma croceum F 1598]